MLTPFHTRIAAGGLLGLLLLFWPQGWRFAAPALSPFLGLCAPIANRSLSFASLAALPMLVLLVYRRRFWCHRLCPVGLIADSCGKLGRARLPTNIPSIGRLLVLTTLGGALFGYPVFLWMDPLAIFGGAFNITRLHRDGATPWALLALPLVMAVSLGWPGIWCSRLCPLGAAQDLLALPANSSTPSSARRSFLLVGSGALLAAVMPRAWARLLPPPLRPPGAVPETAFEGGCIRCGSCSRVCPTGIIQAGLRRFDVPGFLAPQLHFTGSSYCRQDCNRCGQVCPTGVIRPLELAAKNRHVIGIARIRQADCYLAIEKECGVCVPRCPRAALADGFDYQSYKSAIQVIADRCNGCGACVGICPPKVIEIEPAALS